MTKPKKRKRWLKVLGSLVLVLVVGYVVMSFIYRLPDISSRTQSYMIDDGQATRIGRQFGEEVVAHPGKSGVFLLRRGRDAFAARALLARPRVLLLDEPSLGLAPIIVNAVFDIIKALKQRRVTILLVEQNVERALSVADRAYVMASGRIEKSGAAGSLSSAEIEEAYLGISAAPGR